MKKSHVTEQKFSDLPLDPNVIKGLINGGFEYCTPIQAAALPVMLAGQDIAGQAQTGTGKTLAFLIATFHRLLTNPTRQPSTEEPRSVSAPRAIILAPTRELAIQIYQDAAILLATTSITAGLAYGGEPYEKQKKKLEGGVDILIGTCGRIIDYCKQGFFDLSYIEVVVLDEADRMFDLGFIKDIRFLFKKMPPSDQRYNMLFSATLSYRVSELAFEQMNSPVRLDIEPEQKTGIRIKEEIFHPSNDHKMRLLQTIIEQEWPDKAIIFANTKHTCEQIWGHLSADGHRVGLLTGDVAQNKREQILQQFMKGTIDLLVATDVAARGLHIPLVTHVFNYDLPDDAEDYVHRIGRTGRAGQSGVSISFACEDYAVNLPAIELFIEHQIPVSNYDPDLLLSDLPVPISIEHIRHDKNNNKNRNDLRQKRDRQKKQQRTYRK